MKKRFSLVLSGALLSVLLLFAGCGEGKGADATGDDGKVGNRTNTTSSTSSHTAATTGDNLLGDAQDLVEDVLPGDNMTGGTNGTTATNGNNTTHSTTVH